MSRDREYAASASLKAPDIVRFDDHTSRMVSGRANTTLHWHNIDWKEFPWIENRFQSQQLNLVDTTQSLWHQNVVERNCIDDSDSDLCSLLNVRKAIRFNIHNDCVCAVQCMVYAVRGQHVVPLRAINIKIYYIILYVVPYRWFFLFSIVDRRSLAPYENIQLHVNLQYTLLVVGSNIFPINQRRDINLIWH